MTVAERIRFSLRFKFLLAIAGLVLLIGTVFFLFSFFSLHRSVFRLTVAKNEALVESYAASVQNLLHLHNELELDDQSSLTAREEGVLTAYVLDQNGMFLTHSDFNLLGRQRPLYRVLRLHSASRPFLTAVDDKGKTVWIFSAPVNKTQSAHIEISPRVVREPLTGFLVRFSIFFLFLLATGLLLALFIANALARPIRELTRGVEIVSAGDFDHRIPLRSQDEIGILTRAFNRMTVGIREMQSLRIQQERIRNELEFASEIQMKLIPDKPLDFPDYRIGHLYSPAKEIGGDYYDFFPRGDGRLGFVLCDVSGHGVPAAMVMSMLKTIFLALAGRGMPVSPAETLAVANVLLRKNIRQNVFATACYGELDMTEHRMTFAMAGAEKLLQFDSGTGAIRDWKSPGMPLGLMEDVLFRSEIREETIPIAPGESLFLYTDGLTDVRNTDGGFFGEEGVCRTLGFLQSVAEKDFGKTLIEETRRFRGSEHQEDDLSFLLISRKREGASGG